VEKTPEERDDSSGYSQKVWQESLLRSDSLQEVQMKLRNHAVFGIYLMNFWDATLWVVMGMILGAILAWVYFVKGK